MNQNTHNCPEHDKNQNTHQHGKKHGLMMLLCCAAMVLGIMVLPRLGGGFAFLGVLLCPLLHIVMMGYMFKSKKDS